MLGAFTGFVIIGVLIAAGYLVARVRLLPEGSGPVLHRVAFFVASPALLFTVVARADVHVLFSQFLLVSAGAALLVAGLFVVVSRVWFPMPLVPTTMGAATSAYVNANNIGLPVATYILGNAQYVAPQIMLQVLVFSPVILGILDLSTRGEVHLRDVLAQPVRNPIVLATGLGALVAVAGWQVPEVVLAPLQVLGGAAVPLVLMAFGMSLRGQRPLAPGTRRRAVVVATGLKAVVMPAVAYGIGRALALPAPLLFALVVSAALPTAQNMNNYAARYGRAEVLARDVVLLSTIAAVPVILVVTALLHP
ncbi:MAG: AEC family transporter [Actinobacteria bacterium]|nr:AEC family transporter [Actinomycetota bacterium]MCG2801354.1 AEC family transporter [Cellulomonas sp.]